MEPNHVLEVDDSRIESLSLQVEIAGVVVLLRKPFVELGELRFGARGVGRIGVGGDDCLERALRRFAVGRIELWRSPLVLVCLPRQVESVIDQRILRERVDQPVVRSRRQEVLAVLRLRLRQIVIGKR